MASDSRTATGTAWDVGAVLASMRVPFFVEDDEKEEWNDMQMQSLRTLQSPATPLNSFHGIGHLTHTLVIFSSVTGMLEGTLPRDFRVDQECSTLYEGLRDLVRCAPSELADFEHPPAEVVAAMQRAVGLDVGDSSEEWDHEGHHDNDARLAQQLVSLVAAIFTCWRWGTRDERLTKGRITDLHKILLCGAKAPYAGCWRTKPVHAGWHAFPTAKDEVEMESWVQEVVDRFEERMHDERTPAVVTASRLLHDICAIHPFENGNGRTARLLFAYALMRAGYPFPVIFTSGRSNARKHHGVAMRRADGGSFDLLYAAALHSVVSSWENFQQNARIASGVRVTV